MAKKLGTLKCKRLFLGTDSGKRGTEVTASAAELNIMDGVTATAAELNKMDGVTATTAELNILDGVTATKDELNLTDNMWASVTTTWTDGTDGTGEVQFVFKDAAGTQMATPIAGEFYFSSQADGLTADAIDSGIAIATNGKKDIIDTGTQKYFNFITTANGLLGLTITSDAGSYWIVFKHPTGKLVISDELAITGP